MKARKSRKPAEVVCSSCGYPTDMIHTQKCNRCWEVEHRIQSYVEDATMAKLTELLHMVESEIHQRTEG